MATSDGTDQCVVRGGRPKVDASGNPVVRDRPRVEIQSAEMEEDRVPEALAVPVPERPPRLIRWIRAFIDSAALFGRPVTSASRNAVNREPGSAQGVVARAGLAALRTARRGARGIARGSARGSPRPCRPRRGLSAWDHPHESLQNPKMKAAPALSGRSRESPTTSDPCRSQRLPSHPWPGGAKRRSLRAPVAQAVPETVVASTTVYQRVPALPRSSHRSPGFLHGWRLDDPCRTTSVVRSNRDQARQGAIA